MKTTTKQIEQAARKLESTVVGKNIAYGDSWRKAGEFLLLLYPNGIHPVDRYTDVLLMVRIFDKMMRIATKKNAFDENPFEDIAGYALLGMVLDQERPGTTLPGQMVEVYPLWPETGRIDFMSAEIVKQMREKEAAEMSFRQKHDYPGGEEKEAAKDARPLGKSGDSLPF